MPGNSKAEPVCLPLRQGTEICRYDRQAVRTKTVVALSRAVNAKLNTRHSSLYAYLNIYT
jgi:hypothetical protein